MVGWSTSRRIYLVNGAFFHRLAEKYNGVTKVGRGKSSAGYFECNMILEFAADIITGRGLIVVVRCAVYYVCCVQPCMLYAT
jgi:hypothetical protein